jgi:flagellum-specific peptidoglycan hydrolase FlgJ
MGPVGLVAFSFLGGGNVGSLQDDFLRRAAAAAGAAGHLFPEYAACEAALESAWGQSGLATRANNLFGQKQSQPPIDGTGTLPLPTKEFLHGQWVTVTANWVLFKDWSTCFHARMRLLQVASGRYPHYAAALIATSGEQFVREVSQTWSTDPARASKVLSIYAAHHSCFAPSQSDPALPTADPTTQAAVAMPAPVSPIASPGLG